MRIAKAEREGRKGRVKALQRILTCSFYAKCLAIKRVTSNKGARTAGVDYILWNTSLQKMKATLLLKRKGYNPLPLKRIYIPKKQKGKLRPISIPTMVDRAMQALWLSALEPIAETRADPNSYGFRPKRAARDAIEQCFCNLASRNSAQWIFEGDIYSCFDKISHDWLLKNIPMDKVILSKFLKAGFMEKKMLYPTKMGVPQGGIIAPTLAVMALSGLEKKLRVFSRKRGAKVNIVSYADDFVITGESKERLENDVIPTVIQHLKEIGLELSQEKSKITHIDDGFNFLGFNMRKYNGKYLTKPSKASIKSFLEGIRNLIKANKAAKTENLIKLLNPKIVGWSNYFRHAVSSRVFSYVDYQIYKALCPWMNKRHPNHSKAWINRKYFKRHRLNNWRFHAMVKNENGNIEPLYLKLAKDTGIRRYVKVKAVAQPYDPEFKEYFKLRGTMDNTRSA